MKKYNWLVVLVTIASSMSYANPIDDKCPQFTLRGAPISQLPTNSTQYICKDNYAIHYRHDTKTAEYVVEHIMLSHITGPAKRKDNFRNDPAIPPQYQSQLSDYAGQPYDRGHLAPGADNTHSEHAMSDSFYLSNMVPQVPNHNRGIWKQLETAVRVWVAQGKDIYVVSGTLYQQGHLTIGKSIVGVPTHLWKVIIDKKSATSIAFIFPNVALPVHDLLKYATSISEIEKTTKINFMPLLPDQLRYIETTFDISKWSNLQ
jgi:endonuclease G, mitochondrial